MTLEICPKSLSPYFRSFVNQPQRLPRKLVNLYATTADCTYPTYSPGFCS